MEFLNARSKKGEVVAKTQRCKGIVVLPHTTCASAKSVDDHKFLTIYSGCKQSLSPLRFVIALLVKDVATGKILKA